MMGRCYAEPKEKVKLTIMAKPDKWKEFRIAVDTQLLSQLN